MRTSSQKLFTQASLQFPRLPRRKCLQRSAQAHLQVHFLVLFRQSQWSPPHISVPCGLQCDHQEFSGQSCLPGHFHALPLNAYTAEQKPTSGVMSQNGCGPSQGALRWRADARRAPGGMREGRHSGHSSPQRRLLSLSPERAPASAARLGQLRPVSRSLTLDGVSAAPLWQVGYPHSLRVPSIQCHHGSCSAAR